MDELLQTAPCGYVEFADDGTILRANFTIANRLGYGHDALVGKRLESILTVAGRVFYQTHIFPLLKLHSKVEEIYVSLKSQSGGEVPVLINAVRLDREGAAVNVCVLVPIQQRSEYEDELLRSKKLAEEAIRAKDEFLALVSHDLRSPLNAILGWTRMLRSQNLDAAMTEKALETIERSANAQSQLIEDILDSSRIISGKLRLDVRHVNPAEVIQGALDVVKPSADAKHVRLQSILNPGASPVSGDPDRLQQVMWNLLSNAIKFSPKGGIVQVRLERINSHVEITVADNGQGINPEFLPFVFERFRQANISGRRQGGLGLGMTITRQLVELHGGTIRAESSGEGKGATFTVELPIAISARPRELHSWGDMEHLETLPTLNGLHVLVVDDERDARELLTELLTRAGARVSAAGTVAEGVECVLTLKPNVLVSDINLNGESGYSLIRAVRDLASDEARLIPAIALTAETRFSDRMRALSAGFQLHLPKPVEPAELITLIANLSMRKQTLDGRTDGPS